MKYIIALTLLVTIISAGYIEPLLAPYWDNANANFATTLTITFQLESGLPINHFFKVNLPSSTSDKVTTVAWRKYDAKLDDFVDNQIITQTTGEITIIFNQPLLANTPYQLRLTSNSEYLEVNGVIGMKTYTSSEASTIVYDSNPVFAHIYLYKALNSLTPVLVRIDSAVNDRVNQGFTAKITLQEFNEPSANSQITQTTSTRLRFQWGLGSLSGYKFTGDCKNIAYGKIAGAEVNITEVLKASNYTCTKASDGSYIDVVLFDVQKVVQPVENVVFHFVAINPGYVQSDSIKVFLYNDINTFTNYGQTLDISIANGNANGTITAEVGRGTEYGAYDSLFKFYQTPDSCNGQTTHCKLVNSATFIITPVSYGIPGNSEIELQLSGTGLTIYGATILTDLFSTTKEKATCLATVDTVRCYNVKPILASQEIRMEVKFSIQESVGSEVISVSAKVKFYVPHPTTGVLSIVYQFQQVFATSKPIQPATASYSHFPAQQLVDYNTLVGAITIPSSTIVVAPVAPDNSTGNTLEIAFDFSPEGYTSSSGMILEIFIPTAFKIGTSTVVGTKDDMTNGIANLNATLPGYYRRKVQYDDTFIASVLQGQKNYVQITNIQFPSSYQSLNSQGSYDIFMHFLDVTSATETTVTSEWLFNVYLQASATTDFSNFIWGPSFWREDGTGNDAEQIPSMLRLIGYATYLIPIQKPTRLGVILKRGLPFKTGNDNQVHCGSNFDKGIKCFYYGSSEGKMTDLAIMSYESYNLFVVDFTELLEMTTISAAQPISVSIPVKTSVGTTLVNTFTSPQTYVVMGMGDLSLREVKKLEFPTAKGFAATYTTGTPSSQPYFAFSNAYTQSGTKLPMIAGQTNRMRMIFSGTIGIGALSADSNYNSVEAAEIVCSSAGLFSARTSAERLKQSTKDICFNLQYPIASGDFNHCIFCGASAIGFPFNVRDTNRDLFDIIEFRNVLLPPITAGALAQTGYFSGFSKGSDDSGGAMVHYVPGTNANEPLWQGSKISSISTTTDVVPKSSSTGSFYGITLTFQLGIVTNITGAFIILTETTPGMTTTGFAVAQSANCEITISGILNSCSVTQTANSFIVDVQTLRLQPQETTLSLSSLTLTNTAADGAYFDARTCIAATCTTAEIVDDFSGKPVFIQYKSGIDWALGVDNLKWQPGICLSMDIHVFGWIWGKNMQVKLSFKSENTPMSLTGIQCNIFKGKEKHSSTKFKTCEVTGSEVIITPNDPLPSGETASVQLCSSSAVPFGIAPTSSITVTGKLFSQLVELFTTEEEAFPRYNVITTNNPYVEGVSDPGSVFELQVLSVVEGGAWRGMKNELMFTITTTHTDFTDQTQLFIWNDDVYANRLGLGLKMAAYIGPLETKKQIPLTLSRKQNEILIVGPVSKIASQTPFLITIQNILQPTDYVPLPKFTVGIRTLNGTLLEKKTATLVIEQEEFAPTQAVAIGRITPTSVFQGELADYTIVFQVLSNSPNPFKVIILDLSKEYYPYSLQSFKPICSLKSSNTKIEISCSLYGNSALKIIPNSGQQDLQTDISYTLLVKNIQNPYDFIKNGIDLSFDIQIYTNSMQVYYTQHAVDPLDAGFTFIKKSKDSYFQIENLNSIKQTSITLQRGGFSFRGCITNLARKAIEADVYFTLIKQPGSFLIKNMESGQKINRLLIKKGRYQVCFEVGTAGTTPVSEYFLGFFLETTTKKYVQPQQIPMFVTDEKISIMIQPTVECLAGGNSVPIRFKLPYSPYDSLTVGISLVSDNELKEGINLFSDDTINFLAQDNTLESFLQIYCDQTFVQSRQISILLSGTNAESYEFLDKRTTINIITTTPGNQNFTLQIIPMEEQDDPLQPVFTMKSSQRGVVYWFLNHDAPWAPDITFEQIKVIASGDKTSIDQLFLGNKITLKERERNNQGMGTILNDNGFALAKFGVFAKTKYYLKAWMQNPSGSIISSSLNFTSYTPPPRPETEIQLMEMLHVVITLELDLNKNVATVKNKVFLKRIEDQILTSMICLGEKGSGIKLGSVQDLYGRTCRERANQSKKRILQKNKKIKKVNTDTFLHDFNFYVQNDLGIFDDKTASNFRKYVADGTVYKDAINQTIYQLQGKPRIVDLQMYTVQQTYPQIFTAPTISSTNYTVTMLIMMKENSYVMAGIRQLQPGHNNSDTIYKRNRRSSQIVWQTLQNSSQILKKFVFGFNNPGKKYNEKVAVFRFSELLPETDFEVSLIQSSQQPDARKGVWSDFSIYKVRTKDYYYSSGLTTFFTVWLMLVVWTIGYM